MATILFSLKKEISPSDKAKLAKHGYVVIEVGDINNIKLVSDLPQVGTSEIVKYALTCVAHKDTPYNLKMWLSDMMVNSAITKIQESEKQKSK